MVDLTSKVVLESHGDQFEFEARDDGILMSAACGGSRTLQVVGMISAEYIEGFAENLKGLVEEHYVLKVAERERLIGHHKNALLEASKRTTHDRISAVISATRDGVAFLAGASDVDCMWAERVLDAEEHDG